MFVCQRQARPMAMPDTLGGADWERHGEFGQRTDYKGSRFLSHKV